MKQRILNLLIALDQLAYVIVTIGEGHPDETLSAAAWRLEKAGGSLSDAVIFNFAIIKGATS